MAHMLEDKHFRDAFCHNQDIHTATAAQEFKVPIDEVTLELRVKAKAENFGIIYGISAFGLEKSAYFAKKEAGEYINRMTYKNS